MFVNIINTKFCVLHIVDPGTRYSECTIVPKRSGTIISSTLKVCWILRHGAPKRFTANSEFSKKHLLKFRITYKIFLGKQPIWRCNKTRVIEKKRCIV